MRFETEAQLLLDFFNKIRGEEYSINIDNQGWHITCLDMNVLFTDAHLKPEVFSVYPKLDKIETFTINNSSKLLSFLNRFKGKIAIEFSGKNIVIATDKRQANITLGREPLDGELKMPEKVNYDKVFKIKTDMILEAIKNSDLLKNPVFYFEVKDDLFSITTKTATDSFVEKETIDFEDALSIFGDGIKEIFSNLSGEVQVGFENNFPLIVKYADKYSTVLYVLAPITENK